MFKKINLKLLYLFLILFSDKSLSITCADLDGAYVASQETTPRYLGFFGNQFSLESIQNTFGTYGNSYNLYSVRNTFGTYGSEFSTYSISNQFTTLPPIIYKHETVIGYLTNNSFISGGISLDTIDTSCSFFQTSPWDNPSPISGITYVPTETTITLAWSGGLGATSFAVYQCSFNDCTNSDFLGFSYSRVTTINNLASDSGYTFQIFGLNSGSFAAGIGVPGVVNAFTLESTLDDISPPEITLKGDSIIYINVFETYVDPGLIATDNVDTTIQTYVSGEVDTTIIGAYDLLYAATDSSDNTSFASRTVVVEDKIPPMINLLGDEIIIINQYDEFIDPGISLSDNYDEAPSLSTSGNVDSSVVGQYEITYEVVDSSGNASSVTRSVIVEENDIDSVDDEENSDYSWDFDDDGKGDALTDGLMLLRYAFNLRGTALTAGAISADSSLTPAQVEDNVAEAALSFADIDDNENIDALTDGLLLLRYLFNLRDEALIAGAIAGDAKRLTAAEIETYIQSYMP